MIRNQQPPSLADTFLALQRGYWILMELSIISTTTFSIGAPIIIS
ncbi:hypothetical protein LINGRAHAP2_LOCUS32198 [Linum grandiflorum]